MTTADTVILTLLGVVAFIAFLSLVNRMASLDDNLWIEVAIIVLMAFFAYLVVR